MRLLCKLIFTMIAHRKAEDNLISTEDDELYFGRPD